MEPNDIILLAELIELSSLSPEIVSGEIGDNDNLDLESLNNDVDLFGIILDAGDTLFADIEAESNDSTLNSVLSIFNSDGELLAQNDDFTSDSSTIDSFVQFLAPLDATYYVGVSSSANLEYDPTVENSGTGDSSGTYDLVLTRESDDGVYSEPNDTILLANAVELDSVSTVVVSGAIGDNDNLDLLSLSNDVDLFAINMKAGDTLFADINAASNGSSLDSALTIFDANGNLLAQNEDNSFDGVTEPDPFQQFTALFDGTYYVGVSSSGNLDYDPTLENSGTGDSSGTYDLVLTCTKGDPSEQVYSEPNDTILLANTVELDRSSPTEIFGRIGDNPDSDILATNDVDLFEVSLNAGDTLLVNIDAQILGSSLDSVLSIFDAEGNLLGQNEDNSFFDGDELVTEPDPFQVFTALEDGTYYVGVSSSANLDYDPTEENSGVGDSAGNYRLELSFDRDDSDLFTTPINRFQNSARPGTYLFAGPEESQTIRSSFSNFIEEGQAFKVATEPGDNLIRLNRFQNSNVPGTYLYAGEAESEVIRQDFPNFIEEGIAFYVYGGGANEGVDFYRFQNLAVPGTYIFVSEAERQSILANFPNYVEEGVAFEAEV